MSKKILIIEDEEQLLDNITILLKSEGFNIVTARNGQEGLNLAKEIKPDLIICDIMMPEMDGYDVIRKLSKERQTSAIPFIFLTAKVERNDLRKGMELGADDYIFKPFKSDELLNAINIRLNKRETLKASILEEEETHLKNNSIKKYSFDDNIFFKLHGSSILVKVEKIKYITAENQYTYVITEGNKHLLIRRPITKWEQMLPDKIFIRIHRSTIINTLYINKIEKSPTNSYKVILKDTDKYFDISRKYLREIKKIHK